MNKYVKQWYPHWKITECPRSLDPFYVVAYYINWVKTSWTYCNLYHRSYKFLLHQKEEVRERKIISKLPKKRKKKYNMPSERTVILSKIILISK